MKKFIISEEEKNKILGMHKEATKRHYLSEQPVSSTNTNPQAIDEKKKIYNQYLQEINSYVPFDIKQLQGIIATLKSGMKEGGNVTDLDVVQQFYQNGGQEFIQKINPKGYNELTTSDFKNYTSLMSNQSCTSCKQSSVYQMILDDVIKLKSGLVFKAQEKAGYPVTLPTWAQSTKSKAVIDYFAKNIGLS